MNLTVTQANQINHSDGFLSKELLRKISKKSTSGKEFFRLLSEAIPATDAQPPPSLFVPKTVSSGPWRLKDNGVLSAGGKTIGTFHNANEARRAGIDNRNLVLTASEMLDFCQKVADTFGGLDDPLGKEARALVEKAKP